MRQFSVSRAATLGGALCGLLAGCYSYAALPPSGARVGDRVRVHVSGAESDRLEPMLGFNERAVEGELLEQGDSEIALAVALPSPAEAGGLGLRTRQRIVIPRADLQAVDGLRLDKFRTGLLIGGVAAVAVAVAGSTGALQPGSRGTGGGPNERRVPPMVPLVRWRVPVP